MAALRQDLLRGAVVSFGGDPQEAARERLRALGAQVELLPEALGDEAAQTWAGEQAPLDAFVFRAPSRRGVRPALDATWCAVRAVANGALIPAGRPAKIVLLAPARGLAQAEATRAAIENLARTLSVEWARYQLTTAAVMPGAHADERHLAELVAFLVSPAGAYFSGCRIDLGVVAAA